MMYVSHKISVGVKQAWLHHVGMVLATPYNILTITLAHCAHWLIWPIWPLHTQMTSNRKWLPTWYFQHVLKLCNSHIYLADFTATDRCICRSKIIFLKHWRWEQLCKSFSKIFPRNFRAHILKVMTLSEDNVYICI